MSEKFDLPARRIFIGSALTIPFAFVLFPKFAPIKYRELTVTQELQRSFRKTRSLVMLFGGFAVIGGAIGRFTRNTKFA